MKNLLGKVSLEKLEDLPSKQSYRECLSSKFEIKREYCDKDWHNHASELIYKKSRYIIDAGVGQPWNDVYSKLTKLVKGCRFEVPYWIRSNVSFIHIDKDGEWWMGDLHRGGMLSQFGQSIWNNNLYVHPYTGILCSIEETPSLKWRKTKEHYERLREIRKRDKERKIKKLERELAEMKFINNPTLHKYFIKLALKEKELMRLITKSPVQEPRYQSWSYAVDYNGRKRSEAERKRLIKKDWDYWAMIERWRVREAKEASKAIIPVQEKLQSLISGNLTSFYESDDYLDLYRQQKECHHYAQP